MPRPPGYGQSRVPRADGDGGGAGARGGPPAPWTGAPRRDRRHVRVVVGAASAAQDAQPRVSTPRISPPLADSLEAFLESQDKARAFIRASADLDLTGTKFVNPFVRGIRFSLATGLHVIAAHDRRHLWQAWNVRAALLRPLTSDAVPTSVVGGLQPAARPSISRLPATGKKFDFVLTPTSSKFKARREAIVREGGGLRGWSQYGTRHDPSAICG